MNYKVLVLEWTTELTRDRLVSTLISNYLRSKGVNIIEGPLQNGRYLIDREQPDVLLLVNTIGAVTSLEVASYAKRKRVCVISMFGEGNFSANRIEQFVWGHNKSKEIVDHFRLLWSQRALSLTVKNYKQLAETSFVGGSVGADNYILGNGHRLINEKQAKHFKCVVGIGCWNFCLVNPLDHRFEGFSEYVGMDEVERLRKDALLFRKEINELVSSCPEILFLVKEHPHKGATDNAAGVDGLEQFDNVIFADKDASIVDCIKSSDIWLTYESTTALEAWLLGKPSALLNPSGTKFYSNWRSPIYKGQPNYRCSEEWKGAISQYISVGKLPGFCDLDESRKELLKDVFGYCDGLNHVRVGNFILEVLEGKHPYTHSQEGVGLGEKVKSHVKNFIWRISSSMERGKLWKYIPKNLHRFRVRRWDNEELDAYMQLIYQNQKAYYQSYDSSLSKLNVEREEKIEE